LNEVPVQSVDGAAVPAESSPNNVVVPDKPFRRAASMNCTRHPGIVDVDTFAVD